VGAGERRGGSRFGRERLGIDRHQHGCVGVMPNGTLVETADARKGTFEFIHLCSRMHTEMRRALIGRKTRPPPRRARARRSRSSSSAASPP
jgi:hypothetical protein